MNNFVQKKGYTTQEILINYRARLGEKKLKARHGITILNRIIKDLLTGFYDKAKGRKVHVRIGRELK